MVEVVRIVGNVCHLDEMADRRGLVCYVYSPVLFRVLNMSPSDDYGVAEGN